LIENWGIIKAIARDQQHLIDNYLEA